MEECSGGAEGADALIGGDAGARSGGAARADSHSGPMSHARNASSAQLQIRYFIKYYTVHVDFARAQIANSYNILNLYQIRNLKSYCKSVLEIK